MADKIKDAVESVKDKVLQSPTYKTTTKKFRSPEEFAKALLKGDTVKAIDAIGRMPSWGIAAGSQHEIVDVKGSLLVLKSGKSILAEWFVPEVSRRERIRRKPDMNVMLQLATLFATKRWEEFRGRIDAEIAAAEKQAATAQLDLERAQNKLKQSQDNVARLKVAKVDGGAWPRTMAVKLMALIEQKVFTSFEIVKEGAVDVFIVYTGPIWVEKKKAEAGKEPELERGEYAMKVYPAGSPTRVVVENVAPGKLPGDVPYNEGRQGPCNICFGGQNEEAQALIQNEDWTRVLTMIRVYLEGNRSN